MSKKYSIKKDVKERIQKYETFYANLFYNKWIGSRDIEGDIDPEQAYYIMKKFWSEGTVASWNIKSLNTLGFAPYTVSWWNMYDFPSKCRLVNVRGVSEQLIPNKEFKVNKDVVLGWCNKAHKPILFFMKKYIDRLVQLELLMDNNLGLQNIPFLLKKNGKNEDKVDTIINCILNGEIVISVDGDVMDDIDLLQTQVELHAQEFYDLINRTMGDALTFLGINNNPFEDKKERQIVDEVNSNNQEIKQSDEDISGELNIFSKQIKKILGKTITFKSKCDKMYIEDKKGVEDDDKEV